MIHSGAKNSAHFSDMPSIPSRRVEKNYRDRDSQSHVDDEDDDEPVIFYRESSSKQPSWELSQISVASSSRGDEEPKNDPRNQAVLAELAARKRKRRSGGRRYRRGSELSDYDYDVGSENEADDGFASLRSKIGGASQEETKDPYGKESETQSPVRTESENIEEDVSQSPSASLHSTEESQNPSRDSQLKNITPKLNVSLEGPRDSNRRLATPSNNNERSISLQRQTESDSSKTKSNEHAPFEKNETLCSPPDFDFCGPNDDDSQGENNNENVMVDKINDAVPGPGIRTRHPEGDNSRVLSRKRNRNRHSQGKEYHRTATVTSVSTINRRRAPDQIERFSVGGTPASTLMSKSLTFPSQALTQSKTNVETCRSIVGLRPTHWSRNPKVTKNHRNKTTQQNSTKRLANPSALAAATRNPFQTFNRGKRRQSNKSPNIQKPLNVTLDKGSDPPAPSAKTPVESSNTDPKPKTINQNGLPNERMRSSFSFAPSFVPTNNALSLEDTIGEDDSGDECRVVTTKVKQSIFASATPPKRRRRHKSNAGGWLHFFRTLQNVRNKESLRLQNPAYGGSIILDVNDPRKRAKTLMDVTILGNYNGPWINLPDDTKITVPGCVHKYTLQPKSAQSSGRDMHQEKEELPANQDLPPDSFAWFTFTLATARRVELQQMSRLRIYNAIVLPSRLRQTFVLPPKSNLVLGDQSIEANSTENGFIQCRRIVICTQLCERTS